MSDIKKYEPLWNTWYVESLIGEGSFGKVYRVRRDEFGKTGFAAVKIISVPQNVSEVKRMEMEGLDTGSIRGFFHAQVQDIIREIVLMDQFRKSDHIVGFDDYQIIETPGEIGWDILIRMELLKCLTDYAQEETLTRAEILKLGIHICRALETCLQKKIIHRDIKTDNIFVSRYGEYKLGDFGIARQAEHTMSGMSRKGTYTSMAPEVFKGERYGASADTYSLGIVLYALLNKNRVPFLPDYPRPILPNDRDNAVRRRMNGEPIPALSQIGTELNVLVLKACSYNRQERFTSPGEMRQALEMIVEADSLDLMMAAERPRLEEPPIPQSTNAAADYALNHAPNLPRLMGYDRKSASQSASVRQPYHQDFSAQTLAMQDSSAQTLPVQGTPLEEIPMPRQSAPMQGAPMQGVPVQRTPAQAPSAQDPPMQDPSRQGVLRQRYPKPQKSKKLPWLLGIGIPLILVAAVLIVGFSGYGFFGYTLQPLPSEPVDPNRDGLFNGNKFVLKYDPEIWLEQEGEDVSRLSYIEDIDIVPGRKIAIGRAGALPSGFKSGADLSDEETVKGLYTAFQARFKDNFALVGGTGTYHSFKDDMYYAVLDYNNPRTQDGKEVEEVGKIYNIVCPKRNFSVYILSRSLYDKEPGVSHEFDPSVHEKIMEVLMSIEITGS